MLKIFILDIVWVFFSDILLAIHQRISRQGRSARQGRMAKCFPRKAQGLGLETKLWRGAMAFDKDFITSVFEAATEEQVEKVLKEYESDLTGLKVKRDEIFAKNNEYKESLDKISKERETEKAELLKQIEEMDQRLKASGTEETKAYFEAEKKKIQDSYAAKISDYETKTGQQEKQFMELSAKYIEVLKNTEIDRAMDKIQNLDRAKANMLRDLIKSRNQFDLLTVDGEEKMLSKDHRGISDTINAFVATDEGKFFLQNNNSGGGAPGSTNPKPQTGNPFLKGKENLDEQGRIFRENPALFNRLKAEAESVASA